MKKALIITVFNEEKTIFSLIDSILTQTVIPDEIIIVDGGSTDRTVSSIKYQVSGIKRIKFHIIVKKGNRSVGRNEAIKNSKAEVIAITDAGCILDKNWFKSVTEPFKNKSVDVVAGYYKAKTKSVFQKCLVPYVFVMPDHVDPESFLPATRSMAIRKSVWKKIGGFDEKLSNNEDYAFARKIKEAGFKIKFEKLAVVTWIPRANLRQAFYMFYRFAKGDAEAGIFRPKVLLIFFRYFAVSAIAILYITTKSYFILNTLYLILVLYLAWSVSKNYRYVKDPKAWLILPLIQFTADAAVLSGTLLVLITRFLPVVAVVFFLISLFSGINLPYVGQNAYNFITYSQIAHNYNQFGYLTTKLAPLITVSSKIPNNPELFIHHPPLLSIIESIFLKYLGENFWVGRLMVALFTIGSVLLIYLIEQILTNKKHALLTVAVACLIPATSIFGKMIGQEPLVLFFILGEIYFSIRFVNSSKAKFLLATLVTAILASLSDWPGAYFSIFLLPLYFKHKKTKIGLLSVLVSCLTVLVSVIWIIWIRSGFWDLQHAAGSRFVTALFSIPNWPIRWVAATFARLIIYFNPIIIAAAFLEIGRILGAFKNKKLSDRDLVTIALGGFGLFHIILYAEASFTHPYILYYLVPFVVFLASGVLAKLILDKSYLIVCLTFMVCAVFLMGISYVKEEQIKSNIWRYKLAYAARRYLNTYETIIYNNNYAIDNEIWLYPLLISPKRQDKNDSMQYLSHYEHYVYSCTPTCGVYIGQMKNLKSRYKYILFKSKEAEAYLFFLKKSQDGQKNETNMNIVNIPQEESTINLFANVYREIRDILKVPQL